jgi:hypothetical protein
MAERHLLIRRHGHAYLLEATHGADRVELGTFAAINDARDAARGVRAWTQLPIVDRSGAE